MIQQIEKFKVYIYLEWRFQNLGKIKDEFHSSEWIGLIFIVN